MNLMRITQTQSLSSGALLLCSFLVLSACKASDPCPPGYEVQNAVCSPIPAPPKDGGSGSGGGGNDAGDSGTDSGTEPAPEPTIPTNFGDSCTDSSTCGGDSPICGAPDLPYCTNVSCGAGESNEGICPADWLCYAVNSGGITTVCLNL